jgi:chromate transporter
VQRLSSALRLLPCAPSFRAITPTKHSPERRLRGILLTDLAETPASAFSVFLIFLRLGLTSFGGPVAHLGYFRDEFVRKRQWLDETGYADIVALCQFLPGPASSQVAVTIGMLRARLIGGLAAWLGFTLPSALALTAFGAAITRVGHLGNLPWLHGLKIVAVAVVAQAVWGMARTLCPDRERMTLAIAAAIAALALPSAAGQIGAIAAGGLIGWIALRPDKAPAPAPLPFHTGRKVAVGALILFFVLLIGLPWAAAMNHGVDVFARFYRAGALVFGGGHVVLPLLQQAVVPQGLVDKDAFLAGYGAAQAVPGPLFTFAAYLGAVMRAAPNGWAGAALCLTAIYLPSFLLLVGVLPFWDALRARLGVQAALRGVNAVVVGLLLAALYTPVWTSAIFAPSDFALVAAAFLLLAAWRTPPWLVVLLGALSAQALALI